MLALHSEMLKKPRLDSNDVNMSLMLSDTSPVIAASAPQYVSFGDEKLCCQVVSYIFTYSLNNQYVRWKSGLHLDLL